MNMSKPWLFTSGLALGIGLMLVWAMESEKKIGEPLSESIPTLKQVPDYLNEQWANNKLWYDGNAEVNIYKAKMNIYGKARSFEYAYVFVKEDFTPKYRVKADRYDEKGAYMVMKCNQFARVPTENYPYHFLTSVFTRWENPQPIAQDDHGNPRMVWQYLQRVFRNSRWVSFSIPFLLGWTGRWKYGYCKRMV